MEKLRQEKKRNERSKNVLIPNRLRILQNACPKYRDKTPGGYTLPLLGVVCTRKRTASNTSLQMEMYGFSRRIKTKHTLHIMLGIRCIIKGCYTKPYHKKGHSQHNSGHTKVSRLCPIFKQTTSI